MEKEYIEIRNYTRKEIKVSACRSKMSGILYVEIWNSGCKKSKVPAHGYEVVEVKKKKF